MKNMRFGVMNTPQTGRERKGDGKETFPPSPPIEKRERKREQDVSTKVLQKTSKTARACVGARGRASYEQPGGRQMSACARFKFAGAVADEILSLFGNRSRDRAIWSFYCYHYDAELILEKAREIASCHRQGELRFPVRAFQRWLADTFGKGGAK